MALYGPIWPYMTLIGRIWPYMTLMDPYSSTADEPARYGAWPAHRRCQSTGSWALGTPSLDPGYTLPGPWYLPGTSWYLPGTSR